MLRLCLVGLPTKQIIFFLWALNAFVNVPKCRPCIEQVVNKGGYMTQSWVAALISQQAKMISIVIDKKKYLKFMHQNCN
jgi:hypothetical protein